MGNITCWVLDKTRETVYNLLAVRFMSVFPAMNSL